MIRCAIVGRVQFDCSANKKDLSMSAFWLFVLWLTDSLFCFLLPNFCMYSVCVLALCFNLCSDSLIFCLLAIFCVLTLCFLFGSDPLFFYIFIWFTSFSVFWLSVYFFVFWPSFFNLCSDYLFSVFWLSVFVCVLPSVYLFVFWLSFFCLLSLCFLFVFCPLFIYLCSDSIFFIC